MTIQAVRRKDGVHCGVVIRRLGGASVGGE